MAARHLDNYHANALTIMAVVAGNRLLKDRHTFPAYGSVGFEPSPFEGILKCLHAVGCRLCETFLSL